MNVIFGDSGTGEITFLTLITSKFSSAVSVILSDDFRYTLLTESMFWEIMTGFVDKCITRLPNNLIFPSKEDFKKAYDYKIIQ